MAYIRNLFVHPLVLMLMAVSMALALKHLYKEKEFTRYDNFFKQGL